MGAAGALALLTRYQAFAARRMVVLGSGPLGLAVATLARARGIEVPAIVEVSPALRGDAGDAGPARAPGRALLPGPRGRRGAGEPRRDRGGPPRRARRRPPDGPGTRGRHRLRHGVPRHRPRAAGRAPPDPGLPARVPLRARGVRPRDRRRAAHQPARRLRRRRRRGRRRRGRDVARPGRGGGPPRGARRRGLARGHPARARPGRPARGRGTREGGRAARARLLAAVAPRHARGRRMGHPRVPVRGGHARRAGRRPAAALSRPGVGPDARPERSAP